VKLIRTTAEVTALTGGWRAEGEKIVLVPTMGWFHAGHLSLMRLAQTLGSRIIVSLFVNPIQFGPREDLGSYPRDLERDCRMAEMEGVDALFAPAVEEMFEPQFQTRVSLSGIAQGLCGADRPGHFDGVATIVTKLFHLMVPHIAVFGEKDLQQLAVIRRMVRDLNFAVEVVGHPIVREADGLAMSSRNSYLTGPERKEALCLHQAICLCRDIVEKSANTASVADLIAEAERSIHAHDGCHVEYVQVVDRHSLLPCATIDHDSVMALAVKINGRVRLIDNGLLLPGTSNTPV
jgi:pantoate--beta-alanine ligase